jgi:DNA (cytosine-5)-methyltransferase 1
MGSTTALNSAVRRSGNSSTSLPRIVSLFCGAGGLDIGFRNSGFPIEFALDKSSSAIDTHKRNFPESRSLCVDLQKLGAEGVCNLLLEKLPAGSKIAVIGGPPCQGFSRANAASRHDDPRNDLIVLYLDIVRKLAKTFKLEFVVFENVLGIKDAKHSEKFAALLNGLRNLGLMVTDNVCCALDYGVPQMRRRVILIGLSANKQYGEIILKKRTGKQSVKEAIGHLGPPAYFRRDLKAGDIPTHPNHWTMMPRSPRFSTPVSQWKKTRSFKRTFWNEPSPTIAFGHREIHIHPTGKRRLSIHEALLLQGFSKEFVLEGNLSQQTEQVSNAVPPPLAESIAISIKVAMDKSNG